MPAVARTDPKTIFGPEEWRHLTSRSSLRAGPGFSRRASTRKSLACINQAEVSLEICKYAMVSPHRDDK